MEVKGPEHTAASLRALHGADGKQKQSIINAIDA